MNHTYIIAEAGVNHNGSLDMAFKLIDTAVDAGVDAIKFQTFKAEKLVTNTASKADYQKQNSGSDGSQLNMLKALELSEDDHLQLINYCQAKKISFLSTPFELESLDLLANKFDLPIIKIPSGEITNLPFLLEIAKYDKKVILSTGMSTLGEIENALGALAFGYLNLKLPPSLSVFQEAFFSKEGQAILQEKVVLLHCTTEYPAPFAEVNLLVMDTLKNAFNLPVGYSDHTIGVAVPIAAVAKGAVVIEKHFTLDKTLPGPDHKASLEPSELKLMVESIRQVENALGKSVKISVSSEVKNKAIARKSLVAAEDIKEGEIFTKENLTVKRPGHGISPSQYWDWLGKKAHKSFQKDEVITP